MFVNTLVVCNTCCTQLVLNTVHLVYGLYTLLCNTQSNVPFSHSSTHSLTQKHTHPHTHTQASPTPTGKCRSGCCWRCMTRCRSTPPRWPTWNCMVLVLRQVTPKRPTLLPRSSVPLVSLPLCLSFLTLPNLIILFIYLFIYLNPI